MKRFLSILLLTALLTGVALVPAVAEEPQKITVAGLSWQITKFFVEDIAKAYMEAHPGVEIEITTISDVANIPTFAIDWAHGETEVDVLINSTASFAAQFVAGDLIWDFEELGFYDQMPKDKFIGVGLEEAEINGHLYGAPVIVEAYALNVNNKAMKEAGLWDEANDCAVMPTDWDNFYEMAEKLHKVENGKVVQQGAVIQWGISMWATMIASKQALDGTIYDENGVLNFDTPAFRHMLEVWQKGAKSGVFSKETYADNMAGRNSFKAGITAMLFETGGAFVEANVALGDGSASLTAFPGAADRGSVGFSSVALIPKASKSPKLAMDFIKEALLGEYAQTNTVNVYGKMPAVAEYFKNADLKDWVFLQGVADKSAAAPKYKDSAKFNAEVPAIIQAYLDESVTLDQCMENLAKLIESMDKDVI